MKFEKLLINNPSWPLERTPEKEPITRAELEGMLESIARLEAAYNEYARLMGLPTHLSFQEIDNEDTIFYSDDSYGNYEREHMPHAFLLDRENWQRAYDADRAEKAEAARVVAEAKAKEKEEKEEEKEAKEKEQLALLAKKHGFALIDRVSANILGEWDTSEEAEETKARLIEADSTVESDLLVMGSDKS
jgi:hypothetical protein